MSLGERIKTIRLSYGETLESFGARFEPTARRSNVSAWEKNRYTPNPERLKQIAELGGITVDQLLNGGGSMTVDEMKERWVHQDDVEVLRAIYKNEMTVAEFIEAREERISELEQIISAIHDVAHELNVHADKGDKIVREALWKVVSIKKD